MIQIEEERAVSCKLLLLPTGITYGADKPQERRPVPFRVKRLRPWVYTVGLAAVFMVAGIFE